MKKTLISAAFALSLVGFASAQQATSTGDLPPALPPVATTTGSSTIDNQVKALRKEYDAKIKALQQEYLAKLKALIGERKQEKKDERASSTKPGNGKGAEKRPLNASSTKNGEVEGTSTAQLRLLNNQGATTTKAAPKGAAWGFLMRFFGGAPRPGATSTQAR